VVFYDQVIVRHSIERCKHKLAISKYKKVTLGFAFVRHMEPIIIQRLRRCLFTIIIIIIIYLYKNILRKTAFIFAFVLILKTKKYG
jgi:hypothetical protein